MRLKTLFIIAFIIHCSSILAVEYKTYQFNDLSHLLNYPNDTYFGSTEDEISDLETYTSKEDDFYKEINNYLRFYPKPYDWSGTGPTQAKTIVTNIDQIFTKVPSLPENLILFRGVNLKHRKNKSYSIGEEIIEKGYLSTTTTFEVADYFATKINPESLKSKNAILVIYQSSKDQKGILFDQGEDEVLIKHNQKLKIMSLKKSNPNYETYLVQACLAVCEASMNVDIIKFWNKYSSKSSK